MSEQLDSSTNPIIKSEPATVEEKDNPYAYLNRDFSSENYKIEIKNLPKYYGISVSWTYSVFQLVHFNTVHCAIHIENYSIWGISRGICLFF